MGPSIAPRSLVTTAPQADGSVAYNVQQEIPLDMSQLETNTFLASLSMLSWNPGSPKLTLAEKLEVLQANGGLTDFLRREIIENMAVAHSGPEVGDNENGTPKEPYSVAKKNNFAVAKNAPKTTSLELPVETPLARSISR